MTSRVTQESTDVRYNDPVMRYCKVCQSLEHSEFSLDQVSQIRKEVSKLWKTRIRTELEEQFKNQHINYYFRARAVTEEYREGPLILFPPAQIEVNGFKVSYRPSLTVCVPPNRSKIWVRSRYISGGKRNPSLDYDDVEEFFKAVTNVSDSTASALTREYSEILDQRGFIESSDEFLTDYAIAIKAVSSNDATIGRLVGLIREGQPFSMTEKIHDRDTFRALRSLLRLMYGRDIQSDADYEKALKELPLRWIGFFADGDAAIFGRLDPKDKPLTEFVGLTYDSARVAKAHHKQSLPQKISRALVHAIAPSI